MPDSLLQMMTSAHHRNIRTKRMGEPCSDEKILCDRAFWLGSLRARLSPRDQGFADLANLSSGFHWRRWSCIWHRRLASLATDQKLRGPSRPRR